MIIGNRTFDFDNNFYMMGILNVTPDSFSDGGKYDDMDSALRQAEKLIADGADIIDVGGESTRPDHIKITEEQEIERVCPVIEKLKDRFDVPVSLDTYKAEVAAAGIDAGADLINDIWGLKWDRVCDKTYEQSMAEVIAKAGLPCCLMHNRDKVYIGGDSQEYRDTLDSWSDKGSLHNTGSVQVDNPFGYNNYIEDVIADIQESIEIALEAGIMKDNIMIDPGIGFAKDLQQNLNLMNHLDELCKLRYPVLLGTSRKSMIGLTLDLPVGEREEGTIATSVLGYQAGCRIFRVHDVKANLRALRMTEAITKAGRLS